MNKKTKTAEARHPVDVHVGKRLRLIRSMLGMSQETLGKAIGVTFQQIQKYERGINRVGSSRLYEFSKILSVPVSYFFEDLPDELAEGVGAAGGFAEGGQDFERDQLSSKESISLVRAYCRIKSPDVRKKVLGLVKSLSASNLEQEEA